MKNRLFRLFALLLAVVMLMGTIGCGSSSDGNGSGNGSGSVEPGDRPDYSGDNVTVPDVETDDYVSGKVDENGDPFTGVDNGLLYVDGELYNGVYDGKLYGDGELFTGFLSGKRYDLGVLFTGTYNNQNYKDGVVVEVVLDGYVTEDGKLYFYTDGNGVLYTGTYQNKYYSNGVLLTGINATDNKFYVEGVICNTTYQGVLYQNGVKAQGLVNGLFYKDGTLFTGVDTATGNGYINGVLTELVLDNQGQPVNGFHTDGKLYTNGVLFTGVYASDGKYYDKGVLYTGTIFYQNKLYSVTSGTLNLFTGEHENKYYELGDAFTGIRLVDGKLYNYSVGVKGSAYTGKYTDGKVYKDGSLLTGIYSADNKMYKDGVVFSGKHTDGKLYDNGALYSGIYSVDGKMYANGVVLTGVASDNKTYVEGVLANGEYNGKIYNSGVLLTGVYSEDNKYYKDGVPLTSGTVKVGETVYAVSNGTMTLFTGDFESKYYENGTILASGFVFVGTVLYQVTNGNKTLYTGEYNGQNYTNGVVAGGTTTVTDVTFAYFADEEEAAVIQAAIDWYNANDGVTDNIRIVGQPKPGTNYVDYIERLDGLTVGGPDVFLVGDRYIKRWSSRMPLLENLQPYIDADSSIDMSNFWASAVWRNKYDPVTTTSNHDDPMYAMPRDLSPTSIYYNQSVFEKHGIACISVDIEDIEAFNNGAPDRNGKTKSDYGLDGVEILERGFYRENPYDREYGTGMDSWLEPSYTSDGKINEVIYFNNRIAMNWDEVEDLGMIFTAKYNTQLSDSDTRWGYYTEWWFSYGWSVGGDCLEDTTGNGDWTFTLGDKTQKKLLYNADGSYATNEMGKAIFVKESEWSTYPLTGGQYLGEVLPTQYEAFKRFYDLGRPIENGGLEIAMRQKADISTSSADKFFTNGDVAMIVQPSTAISNFRKTIGSKFTWDVAPLPVYKEYADVYDGNEVVNQGIQIGHSAETSIGIWTNSKNKAAAFKVVKYFSTGYAQTLQAEAGYFLPNDITLAQTTYVNANATPKNIDILTEIATLQQPADWWYMTDNKWIDVWATPLNTQYRESAKTVDEFFATYTAATNAELAKYKTN